MTEFENVPQNSELIVQKYIDNPLLLDGLKTDIRIHVLVTQTDPLHIYLFEDNFVRRASTPYDNSNWNNTFIHLTNISLNKHNKGVFDATLLRMTDFFRKLQGMGVDTHKIWEQIKDAIIKTIISVEHDLFKWNQKESLTSFHVSKRYN